jgi:hypothetical protein
MADMIEDMSGLSKNMDDLIDSVKNPSVDKYNPVEGANAENVLRGIQHTNLQSPSAGNDAVRNIRNEARNNIGFLVSSMNEGLGSRVQKKSIRETCARMAQDEELGKEMCRQLASRLHAASGASSILRGTHRTVNYELR